ncbi:hypothetical protein HB904_10325 [Listeria booriae]|uniref:Uncharacterized protein n=1 Tax=Listeria booriae TaxID=1552123 RepID=A0A842AC08_9LIST|nr:hypothetical protein [Listeria booriae]MBC1400739.1 hypothetical protein [Listeria booriae]MBC1616586.1 hypothetical protein [Listeria booriae]
MIQGLILACTSLAKVKKSVIKSAKQEGFQARIFACTPLAKFTLGG